MFPILTLHSWAAVGDGCPIGYSVRDRDEVVFVCGSRPHTFEFVFGAGALRAFLGAGADALREMDALPPGNDAGSGAV